MHHATDTSHPDESVITIHQNPKKPLKAAGILQEYAKGKPDLDAEKHAVVNTIAEKYSKN